MQIISFELDFVQFKSTFSMALDRKLGLYKVLVVKLLAIPFFSDSNITVTLNGDTILIN